MILVFLLCTASALLESIIEIIRTPTLTPRYSSRWNYNDLGILTEQGEKEIKKIAHIVKENYSSVVYSRFYSNSTVYVKNCPGAIDALKLQIHELFGSKFEMKLNLVESHNDLMLSPEVSCKKLMMLEEKNTEKFMKSEEYLKINEHYEDLSKILSNFTENLTSAKMTQYNFTEDPIKSIYKLGDFILSYENQGHQLPFNISDHTKSWVKNIYYRYHDSILYASAEQGKLALNEIVSKIMSFIQVSVKSKKSQKFLPFVVDEALMTAILRFLGFGFSSPKPPGFSFFIEIHKRPNKNTVRFFIDGTYTESQVCGLECEVDEFISSLESRKLKQPTKSACENLIERPKEKNYTVYIIIISVVFSLTLLISYWRKIYEFLSKNKHD